MKRIEWKQKALKQIRKIKDQRTKNTIYDEFLKLIRDEERTIPHEVVGLVVKKGMNLVKAWRTYLGMTQAEVAKKQVSPRPPSLRWKRPIMNYVPLRLKS